MANETTLNGDRAFGRRRPAVGVLLLALAGASGCATIDPAELESREFRRTMLEESFRNFERRCNASGRRVIIDATEPLDRNGVPRRMNRVWCT